MNKKFSGLLTSTLCLCTALALLVTGVARAGSVTYEYDELGRVTETTDSAGNVVQYTYDSTGNLLNVATKAASALTVSSFSPAEGVAGSTVVIQGSGFSTTLASNVVNFNGVAAIVTGATASALTVAVPSTAMTGKIAVTVGASTATSVQSFLVSANALPPTITSFTPSGGAAGTVVTITGTHFSTTPANDKVTFGGTGAVPSAATATSLTVAVPVNAGSGSIGVTTPTGTVQSTGDFTALPGSVPTGCTALYAPSPTTRLTLDGAPATYSVAAATTRAVLFNASQKQYLTLNLPTVTGTPALTLMGPQGNVVQCGSVTSTSTGLQFVQLPDTGTYTLFVTSSAASSLNLSVQSPISGTLTLDGAATALTIPAPARRALVPLPATAQGKNVTLTLTNSGAGGGGVFSLLDAGGNVVMTTPVTATGTATLSPQLSATGMYYALLDPTALMGGTAQLSLTTSSVPTLTINAASATTVVANTTTATKVAFNGTQGQYLTLFATTGANAASVPMQILSPNGVVLPTWSSSIGATFETFNPPVLPASGRYTLVIGPTTAYTGNVSLNLTSPINLGTLVSGAPTALGSTKLPGQGEQLAVNALAGEQISVTATHTGGTGYSGLLTVLSSNGAILGSTQLTASTTGSATVAANIAVSGQYTVLLQQIGLPSSGGTESFQLGGAVDGGTLGINQQIVSSAAALGETTRLYFQGTTGQALTFAAGVVSTGPYAATVDIYSPSGVSLRATTGRVPKDLSTGTSCATMSAYMCSTYSNLTLPETGQYMVVYVQAQTPAPAGTVTMALSTPLDRGLLPGLTNGGFATGTVQPLLLGQGWQFEYNAVAGDAYSFIIVTPDHSVAWQYQYTATGSLGDQPPVQALRGPFTPLVDVFSFGPAQNSERYTVVVSPNDQYVQPTTLSHTFTVANAWDQPIQVDGSSSGLSSSVDGQGVVLSFPGSAGQQITMQVKEWDYQAVQLPATLYIYTPSGQVIHSSDWNAWNEGCAPAPVGTPCTNLFSQTDYATLPETGTYRLWFQQGSLAAGATGVATLSSLSVALSNTLVNSSISVVGSPNPVAIGASSNLIATVTGNLPSGTVTFYDGGTSIGTAAISNGQASLSHAFNTVGVHSVTASYAGGLANNGSTSAAASVNVMTVSQYQAYIASMISIINSLLLSD